MVDYNELVERNQSGVIDDLDFLLEQEGLAEIYLEEMQEKGCLLYTSPSPRD